MPQPKMKIILVNINDDVYGGYWVGLAPYLLRAYAGQYDVAKNYEIIIKQFGTKHSVESIVHALNDENPDVVGLSLYVFNAHKTLEVVQRLSSRVIIGGPHVTDVERELLEKYPRVEIVVTGEGEIVFKNLLEYFAGQKEIAEIPGITTRHFQNKPDMTMIDLDAIPSVYAEIVRDLTQDGCVSIETSRGCPYKCGYCAWSYDRKMRYFNVEQVMNDFSTLCAHDHVTTIYLTDASLFFNKNRAKQILRHIISLAPKQKFYYELNLEHVDDELIELMAQLPNHDFSFGIQAVSKSANEQMGRRFNPENFRNTFHKITEKISKAHLSVDIMYPLPGDTLAGFKESIEFALGLEKVYSIKFNALVLLPGSEFFRNRDKYGIRLRDEESRLVASCNSFPAEDLKDVIKYSNYAFALHVNSKFKECVGLLAKKRNVGMLAIMEELLDSLPFDFYDGGEYPEMITSNMNDEKFILANAAVFFNYGALVAHFKNYSHHEYDRALSGWRSGFIDAGKMNFEHVGLLLKLAWKRLKRRRVRNRKRLERSGALSRARSWSGS